ncbi:MAG: VWA domain-containing protein [Planctomycetes bacterium]|nr:VWA domain-containing protein [Planctomycetota bacterium]
MEWQHPEALYLILPLCAAWIGLSLYSDRRRQRARTAFVARTMWSRILPEESRSRFWTKLLLREVAIVMGLVALAGPRFGTQIEQVIPRGSDLYVLIDVSRSMLADDVPPSRLGRAKADVSGLVNRLDGERIGLIAFAGQAVVKCPLTVDYDSFRRALDELDPNSAPRGGTAIGDAIRKSLEVFHAKADRDQAILLITDGDDQQSYPLEAAAVAAERKVTIFTVGLGDADRGARIPQKGNANTFVEYQGEQVWSKLDGSLLQQIALKTSGVYIPAGTKAYDLGELYSSHLHGRRGSESASQQRIRRSEQYQLFLAIAFLALLLDVCVGLYRPTLLLPMAEPSQTSMGRRNPESSGVNAPAATVMGLGLALVHSWFGGSCQAADPYSSVRDGLRSYSQEEYEKARELFAAAREELGKEKDTTRAVAVAAFDEACASHRAGEWDKARDGYLQAGLSLDRTLATAAHFNLGNLSVEQARKLAGDKPEMVPPDKRQEILDSLMQAIVAYRHCLELQPEHPQSRRNLELVRNWIKYYSDKWREHDRQKRRDESNLIAFLEYLIQTQTSLKEAANGLPKNSNADLFAELKRAQGELAEEIPTLREKIATELRPQQPPGSPAPAPSQDTAELEQGITLLQDWADTAGEKMLSAAGRLGIRDPAAATKEQQLALDELDKIWEAVIPFHPLLAKELADQTTISRTLNPTFDDPKQASAGEPDPKTEDAKSAAATEVLEIDDEDLAKLAETQERTLKKSRLLAPKAEAELGRMESAPAAIPTDQNDPSAQPETPQPSPEEMKAGYRKAIELAPQAVEQMEAAVTSLGQKDRAAAAQHAEEARRILEEIQKAQPKNKQDQQQQQDKDKQDPQQKHDQQQKQDQQDKKDKDQNGDKPQDKDQKDEQSKEQDPKQQPRQVSQDRIEDALRKVRERQQEKRDRDRKLKAQVLGRSPVDKDW